MPVNETLGILAHAGVSSDQDRRLMMPSPPIRPRSDPGHSRRISTGIAPACVGPSDWPIASAILVNKPPVRSFSPARTPTPWDKPWARPLRVILFDPDAPLNSP
jgi:hypothetical protein